MILIGRGLDLSQMVCEGGGIRRDAGNGVHREKFLRERRKKSWSDGNLISSLCGFEGAENQTLVRKPIATLSKGSREVVQ